MYRFHSDGGHGWLEVPTAELAALHITDKISACSYRSRDGRVAYLEEDCDLAVFGRAKGWDCADNSQVEDIYYREECFIRFLPRFPGRTSHATATFAAGAL